jgi:hypothetical protein
MGNRYQSTKNSKADPSAYYSQYYWWEIIAYNIDIIASANLGQNM